LRRSDREGGKVKNETLGNLSRIDPPSPRATRSRRRNAPRQ
jgi:hypothetical protein